MSTAAAPPRLRAHARVEHDEHGLGVVEERLDGGPAASPSGEWVLVHFDSALRQYVRSAGLRPSRAALPARAAEPPALAELTRRGRVVRIPQPTGNGAPIERAIIDERPQPLSDDGAERLLAGLRALRAEEAPPVSASSDGEGAPGAPSPTEPRPAPPRRNGGVSSEAVVDALDVPRTKRDLVSMLGMSRSAAGQAVTKLLSAGRTVRVDAQPGTAIGPGKWARYQRADAPQAPAREVMTPEKPENLTPAHTPAPADLPAVEPGPGAPDSLSAARAPAPVGASTVEPGPGTYPPKYRRLRRRLVHVGSGHLGYVYEIVEEVAA